MECLLFTTPVAMEPVTVISPLVAQLNEQTVLYLSHPFHQMMLHGLPVQSYSEIHSQAEGLKSMNKYILVHFLVYQISSLQVVDNVTSSTRRTCPLHHSS